ncbi:unnamed protein product [Sordaria macrospora k-hell]|uniref:WGS project CABT00000000 data, contig 2.1 n=1 Tax=Sordaria macrospora (strain ATCC MYA-333 / DSM 997 / K(L3346) / K-hell) TaxID=771870 RepID=F7VM45_SORMK|nr:uncharacterized protein SMAC_07417 [Sordaria macrospora k-hell]CCC06573.1 unnamed protein product [Sordaria macrospora k-hell]
MPLRPQSIAHFPPRGPNMGASRSTSPLPPRPVSLAVPVSGKPTIKNNTNNQRSPSPSPSSRPKPVSLPSPQPLDSDQDPVRGARKARKPPPAAIVTTTITPSGARTAHISTSSRPTSGSHRSSTTVISSSSKASSSSTVGKSSSAATKPSSSTPTPTPSSAPAALAFAAASPAGAQATPTSTSSRNSPIIKGRTSQHGAAAHSNLKSGMDRSSNAQSPTVARMPYDRASTTTTRQPQTASVARGLNKAPLTPKVTTTARVSTASTVSTTSTRRRPESVISSTSTRDREHVVSPVPSYLTGNVTPRTASRPTRVNSNTTTPLGTPSLDRNDQWDTRSSLSITSQTADDPRRPIVTFSPASDVGGPRQDPDSKFFYASEATPRSPAQGRPPVLQQTKSSSFFYVNGGTIPPKENPGPASPSPSLGAPFQQQDKLLSKFVYANGASDPEPPVKTRSRPSSVISTASRATSNRPPSVLSQTHYPNKPTSPIKLTPQTSGRSGSMSAMNSPRSPVTASASLSRETVKRKSLSDQPGTAPLNGQSTKRKSLNELPSRPVSGSMPSRPSSLVMAEPPAVARVMTPYSSRPPSEAPSPSVLSVPAPFSSLSENMASGGFASLLAAAEDFVAEESEEDEVDGEESGGDGEPRRGSVSSPSKSSPQDKEISDLVANARRERKVQDLQITNASLEAINRTLERQLRKQTAELRAYKRLSRSGRLSVGPALVASPADAGLLAGADLDALSEEGSELGAEDGERDSLAEELEDEDDDLSGSEDSADMTPATKALRDAERREKDEERLRLDLSKHQQLLSDSQKINQSLKRCLGWTEELIKEGKRALAYQVKASEVEIGGRVLAPEEVEAREAREREEEAAGEDDTDTVNDTINDTDLEETDNESIFTPEPGVLMPRLAAKFINEQNGQQQSWAGKQTQDRDSGIELQPTDGG